MTIARRRSLGLTQTFLYATLAAATTVNCDCGEDPVFLPSPNYTPATVLDLGDVSVDSEKTVGITVRNDGSAAYNIVELVEQFDADDTGKWTIVVDDAFTTGLSPSQTATITVTYRPCPDAWQGNDVNPDLLPDCPGDPDSGVLSITDNSTEGNREITVAAQPVQAPTVTIRCPVTMGGVQCNVDEPNMQVCNGILFGAVTAGGDPCDLIIEIENEWRNDKPVGTLSVDGVTIEVRDLDEDPANAPTIEGEEVGFSIRDLDGNPLDISAANPLEVPIDAGGTSGTRRFKLRFDGGAAGAWGGLPSEGNGLRFFTSAPDNRVVSMLINGNGAAANLQCSPPQRDLGPVEQATTATTSFSCQNSGNAILDVSSIGVESGNPELTLTTDVGAAPFMIQPQGRFTINVSYTPQDGGIDVETIVIASNDIRNNGRLELDFRAGAVPRCEVPARLVFALPANEEPPYPPRTENLTILSTGFGDCVIERIDILEDNSSKDDFTIDLPVCGGQVPCTINETLPPMSGRFDIPITYDNNDISTTDTVNLHVYTNDPGNPDQIVILEAMDDPCFFPIPIIEVETMRPCVGEPVTINADMSMPGGDGMTTTIVGYTWSWLFAPPPEPQFSQQMSTTTFIPERDGVYFLGLDAINSCGAMSQSQATEMINVSADCN